MHRLWAERELVRARFSGIGIAAHVEVIMVDVNHLDALVVLKRVRNRPAVDCSLFEVHRALVVGMVQLSKANQRDKPRIVDIVGYLDLGDPNLVPLLLMQERNPTTNRTGTLQGMDDLVVTRRIDRHVGSRSDRR